MAIAFIFTASVSLTGQAMASGEAASTMSPDSALKTLKDGNARFVAGKSEHPRADSKRRKETVEGGQHPFAVVLACSDSREAVELIFDQGIGDLFVVRVAGNVSDTDEIGSIEYGAGHLNAPLLVVLGHTKCGAVTAVVKEEKVHGSIPELVDNIVPAVARARAKKIVGDVLIHEAIKMNVFQSIEDLFKRSGETRELVRSGKLKVVGAVYDLEKGTVDWLGEHPDQGKLTSTAVEGHEHHR
ncbi:MAG: carbonic anhydrase [Nitrospinae bacterium]|nr:carbonic anhydrase [Nitrospinota bacterium]